MSATDGEAELHENMKKAYVEFQRAATARRAANEAATAAISAASGEEQQALHTWRQCRTEFYRRAVEMGVINARVVNVLAPTHETSRCTDEHRNDDHRCARCFLLSVIDDPWEISDDDSLCIDYTRERS